MSIYDHAKYELILYLNKQKEIPDNDLDIWFATKMLETIPVALSHMGEAELFDNHFGAELAINVIERLIRRQPLTPLRLPDEDRDDWTDISCISDDPPGTAYQNRRDSAVFYYPKNGYGRDVNMQPVYYDKYSDDSFTGTFVSSDVRKYYGRYLKNMGLDWLGEDDDVDKITKWPYMPPSYDSRKRFEFFWPLGVLCGDVLPFFFNEKNWQKTVVNQRFFNDIDFTIVYYKKFERIALFTTMTDYSSVAGSRNCIHSFLLDGSYTFDEATFKRFSEETYLWLHSYISRSNVLFFMPVSCTDIEREDNVDFDFPVPLHIIEIADDATQKDARRCIGHTVYGRVKHKYGSDVETWSSIIIADGLDSVETYPTAYPEIQGVYKVLEHRRDAIKARAATLRANRNPDENPLRACNVDEIPQYEKEDPTI